MVMIAPLMSTSLRSSGIAVISFDFSAQADLSQRQTVLAGPHADRMQRSQPLVAIVTPPQCLAVHRQDRLLDAGLRGRLGTQRLQPTGEAGLEGGRLQRHQDTPEDVLARDPVGQVEHLQEELFLEGRPAGDRGRPAGAGEHRQERDDEHTDQGMPLIDGRAGPPVPESGRRPRRERHVAESAMFHPPGRALSWKPHRGRYTQRPPKAQALYLANLTHKCALRPRPHPPRTSRSSSGRAPTFGPS